jgi:hypothetical protein
VATRKLQVVLERPKKTADPLAPLGMTSLKNGEYLRGSRVLSKNDEYLEESHLKDGIYRHFPC